MLLPRTPPLRSLAVDDEAINLDQINEIIEARVAERTAHLQDALDLARHNEREIAFRLGRAAEFRDLETGAHVRRMALYTARLAELYGLPAEEVDLLRHAAPLHDIGKVGVPDAILLKPGKLDADEFGVMKKHTEIGGAMLDDCLGHPLLAAGHVIATQHHEKYDGSGYPLGLARDEIHIYGRLAAVADVFDALTSKRVYKPALSVEESLATMNEGKGSHFDPDIVDLLVAHLDDFLAIKAAHADAESVMHPVLELIR